MTMTKPSLDHLVLFVPLNPDTSLPVVPPSLSQNFTITPGGTHADGITSNALIILSDGCYIELITFIKPSAAPTHWWGPDAQVVGWKDWCLTSRSADAETSTWAQRNYERVKDAGYAEPVRGRRTRADGVHVTWAVTFPAGKMGGQHVRGKFPFWCHDETDRSVRVPLSKESITHPCKAMGVLRLEVIVMHDEMLETMNKYEKIFGKKKASDDSTVWYEAGQVECVEGLSDGPQIVLRPPISEAEKKRVEEKGYVFGNVHLWARVRDGKPKGSRERLDSSDGEGRGLWIEYV